MQDLYIVKFEDKIWWGKGKETDAC